MSDRTVAVAGAGIAGLTFAAAFGAHGHPCHVYERAPVLRELGSGVQIAPNAGRVLHALGLGPALARHAVGLLAREIRRWDDGKLLSRTGFGAECEARYGVPYYGIRRGDLHRMLLDLVPGVHTGTPVLDTAEHEGGVRLHLDSPAGTTEADVSVLVGADGIRSAVRASASSEVTVFSGQTMYRGLVPAERVPFLLAEPKALIWAGPGRHFVCYPVGEFVSFSATAPAAGDWRVESWSEPGRVADLAAAYSGWNDDVRRIIEAAGEVSRWALHDREPAKRWDSRRIVLIGDAAHPMLPFVAQGANQAIEDAAVLAMALRQEAQREEADVSAAVDRFTTVRADRVALVQRISRESGAKLHLADGDEQRLRDARLARFASLDAQDWLLGYDVELAMSA